MQQTVNPAFPTTELESLLLPGPAGQLELLTTFPKNLTRKSVAVVCHPHPLYQGTMHNKVVYTIARAADRLGLPSVRFNYRGVGKSAGHYAQALGEQDDLRAVLIWLAEVLPEFDIWLSGFSFGSYIAASVASQPPEKIKIWFLTTIAPAVNHFEFNKIGPVNCPWLVVQGDHDEVVPAEEVYQWVATRSEKIDLVRMPQTTHFFHGELVQLRNLLEEKFRNLIL
jgi:hypothetical protein